MVSNTEFNNYKKKKKKKKKKHIFPVMCWVKIQQDLFVYIYGQ